MWALGGLGGLGDLGAPGEIAVGVVPVREARVTEVPVREGLVREVPVRKGPVREVPVAEIRVGVMRERSIVMGALLLMEPLPLPTSPPPI